MVPAALVEMSDEKEEGAFCRRVGSCVGGLAETEVACLARLVGLVGRGG